MGEIIFGSVVVLISLVFLGNIATDVGFLTSSGEVGPGTWPAILLILILLLGVCNLIIQIRKYRAESGRASQAAVQKINIMFLLKNKMLIGIVTFFAYVFLLDKIGFLFSTPLFLAAYTTLLGQKKWIVRILVALVTTVALYIVFSSMLMVPLPRGYGIFREIALMVESL